MTRQAQVLLWVSGRLEALRAAKLLNGPSLLTPSGISESDQLDATGFRPEESEVGFALSAWTKVSREKIDPDLITLVMRWREGGDDP